MEKDLTCKQHSKPLQLYCKDCKELCCIKCLSAHRKKGCATQVEIQSYAEEELLPACKAKLDKFDKEKLAEEGEFLSLSKTIREGLLKLRSQFEHTLQIINEALGSFENEQSMAKSCLKANLMAQYEELKEAVASEDTHYIASRLNRFDVAEIADSDRRLAEALSKAVGEAVRAKQLAELEELLKSFCVRTKLPKPTQKPDPEESIEKFLYGVCNPQGGGTLLCRYDIKRRKLEPIASVIEYPAVLEVAKRIFLSGGRENGDNANNVSEFIPSNRTLVPKACMNHKKYKHRAQKISDRVFVTIGGCRSYCYEFIAYCEEYSIENDVWKMLPDLKCKRASLGSVFLNNRFLYAIGGENDGTSIEVLDFNEKKSWNSVRFGSYGMSFKSSVMAIPMSNSEILILSGNEAMQVGLLDINLRAVIKWPSLKLTDDYSQGQVSIFGEEAYILGNNGHIHIFNMGTRKFEELDYFSIYPY